MSLAEDLVWAATLAIREAHEADIGIPALMRPVLDASEWTPEARAAVVTVLWMLAEHAAPMQDDEIMWPTYDDLQKLAGAVEREALP